jgi:hypothetical protein
MILIDFDEIYISMYVTDINLQNVFFLIFSTGLDKKVAIVAFTIFLANYTNSNFFKIVSHIVY